MNDIKTLIELPIDELMQAPSLDDIEVFLKLSDPTQFPPSPDHFVKIAYRIEDLDRERIRELKYRGVNSVHLNLENLDRYLTFEQKVLRAAAHAPLLDPKKKLHLIRTTFNHLIRRMHIADISGADLAFLQEATLSAIELLDSLPRGELLIDCLQKLPNDLYNHASLTTILSLLIAKELKWSTPAVLQKIALIGLFHDYSLRLIPEETRNKLHDSLTPAEQISFHEHPEKSAQSIESIQSIGSDILLAIRQHHERLDGSGYPKGLKARKILPLAMIVAVADTFIDALYASSIHDSDRVRGILKNLVFTHRKTLPLSGIIALNRIFKMNIENEAVSNFTRGGLNIG